MFGFDFGIPKKRFFLPNLISGDVDVTLPSLVSLIVCCKSRLFFVAPVCVNVFANVYNSVRNPNNLLYS